MILSTHPLQPLSHRFGDPSPDGPFDFFGSARRAHESAGLNFAYWFDYWFERGYVVKTPNSFFLGGADPEREDAWFVWWAEVHPDMPSTVTDAVRHFLKIMPYERPFIGFCRTIKNPESPVKYFSTKRLLSLTQEDLSNP